ncbi:MAG: sodium-translocating pyrophosphatase [Chloroflexi bacterium]|nr:MAG: sodium-translocating pyrophosphatase [Chloroflexota bacterium]
MVNYIWVPIGVSLLAVLFAAYLVFYVLRRDKGTPGMQKIANAIFAGATAFLNRQYRTIALLALVASILVAAALAFLGQGSQADKINLAWHTAVAFLVGASCSGISGYIGMYVAVQSNSRTASAARRSLGEALVVSLRGGAVSGFLVVALSLLGVSTLFMLFDGFSPHPELAPSLIVGFGFGASFVALFAQLGGGIYTKAADVGADLVGKVEASIPEDDPRNPAVIADLVGDNVGDCAGRGADLFESTAAENIGTMILGATLFQATHNIGWMLFPLVLGAFGIIASAIGVLFIHPSGVLEPGQAGDRDPSQIALNQLNNGYYITCAISVIGMFLGSYLLIGSNTVANHGLPAWVWYGLAGCVGILLSIAFVFITQYYTAGTWRPVREIAASTLTGPATTILSGVTIGFECVVMPVLAISAALGLSYFLGSQVQIPLDLQRLGVINVSGIFGTAVATVGMLMSCAYILAMDTFGPITDNAGGISEMGGQSEAAREVTDALDSVGNTTKALTKGYGLGSAALAAFLLFSAYLDVLYSFKHNPAVYRVDLANLSIFIAALIGITLIFFFCSLSIRAVGAAAQRMIEEVRRQFKEQPNIMAENPDERVDPDYARCVDISTNGALRAMILPGAVAVFTPIVVGLVLGPQAAAGMLMVSTMGGIVVALFLNNGGGAWDNAKKYIEAGFLRVNVKGEVVDRNDPTGIVLGKKSEAHKASVIGDTVGDPFKDTAGPSLHVLIKLLSTITLVLAPLYYILHP